MKLFLCSAPAILLLSSIAFSQEKTDAVDYSHKRGFYTDSIWLALTSDTPGASIYYTLDGSKPSDSTGRIYSGPLLIDSTAMVRTTALAAGMEASKIKTHTFIFPQQVIRQENRMLEDCGYEYSPNETGKVFWTEEMDSAIVDDPAYSDEIIQGLLDIPTLSVVMLKEDLWSENGIHWGANLEERDDDFERECSIEMIYPEGYKGDAYKNWQEDAGIRIQGGGGRWDQGTYDHKQSFTVVFQKKYGAGKLRNEIFADAPHGRETAPGMYDNIILRAGHNKSWGADWDRKKSVYTRDQLGRDLQILMSGFGSHGTFVHLYLNGKYWGLYNPCERPDHHYLANHFGGEAEDWFYAKGKDPNASSDRDGEPGQSKIRFFQATSKNYQFMSFLEMKNWVMVDESIASFLVHGYANPGDGPQYYYGNCNNPPGPVVWTPWDIEDSFDGGSRRTGPPSVSQMIDEKRSGDNGFEAFWTNIDFRMRFNDLVYKHFYNDGVMTDSNVIAAWDSLTGNIYRPIICESARWGDERSPDPMDRDQEWEAARLAVRDDLKGRAGIFISGLRSAHYFSGIPAPKFFNGSEEIKTSKVSIPRDSVLTVFRDGDLGTVYYTTDGTDPRTWDLSAAVSPYAIYGQGTTLSRPTTLKARTRYEDEWSPLHEILVYPESWSLKVLLKPDEPALGTVASEAPELLRLYPNPVSERLFLSHHEEYALYSSDGSFILKGSGTEIDIQGYPEGLYFVIVRNRAHKILKVD